MGLVNKQTESDIEKLKFCRDNLAKSISNNFGFNKSLDDMIDAATWNDTLAIYNFCLHHLEDIVKSDCIELRLKNLVKEINANMDSIKRIIVDSWKRVKEESDVDDAIDTLINVRMLEQELIAYRVCLMRINDIDVGVVK